MMKRLTRISLLIWILLVTLTPISVSAQTSPQEANLTVNLDKDSATLVAGEWITFQTEITNLEAAATPALIAHLNVASLRPGRHVDPEDWSPERTQYLNPIQPGETVHLTWRVHTLFDGDFAVFVTIVAEDTNFKPVGSPALYIHASPDDVLPMRKVLPVVAVVPLFPLGLLIITGVYARIRRK